MEFSEEDNKRIAKNLKTIRINLGFKTQDDFVYALEKNGHYPGISENMIKKYEGGHYKIKEEIVRLYASLSLRYTFEQIVFDDLKLEPNSFVIEDGETFDFGSVEVLKLAYKECSKIFPLFKNKDLMKNKLFSKAIYICSRKIRILNYQEQEMIDAIKIFWTLNCSEAYMNIMSMLGRFYVLCIYQGVDPKNFYRIRKADNYLEFTKDFHQKQLDGKELVTNLKQRFLDVYNNDLTICMQEAAKEDKYKDYVYFYLAARYYFGIMDNSITKMNDDEMNLFGINMMDCLEIIGNKYAKTFKRITRS